MGQFKPMVKMMTTEPSVELKLKKGGSVKSMTKMKTGGEGSGHKKMADGGGAMSALAGTPALVGRPAVNAPVRTPGKPPMAARRKAMAAKPAAPMMKKGGKAEGGESKAVHKAEMKEMKGLEKELKSHESKPASKAHKGLKTGGVALGNAGGFKAGGKAKKMARGGMFGVEPGSRRAMSEIDPQFRANFAGPYEGYSPEYQEPEYPPKYKKGGKAKKFAKGGVAGDGIINTENQGGAYRNTKMHTAEGTDKTSGKTGDVKMGNAGGYKTGGVALGNGGGYKMGGKAKKAYAAGGTVDSGHPVAMPQGRKKPSTPVSINQLSGTFKKGGSVTPAEGRLQKNFAAENATAMRQAKAQSNEVYSKYQKMAKGGMPAEVEDQLKTAENERAYKNWEKSQREENEAMRESILGAPKRLMQGVKSLFGSKAPAESVTKTKESVTVTPGKKRGGRAC